VKEKVQRYLTSNFNSVMVDSQGDFSFQIQSARLFIRVQDWTEDKTIVRVFSPMLLDVPVTQQLKDYVALEGGNYVFGAVSMQVQEDKAQLMFSHTILGDYLDEEELLTSCKAVGATAEHLDDKLKEQFGGRRFHES
jgi:hypothetical protein